MQTLQVYASEILWNLANKVSSALPWNCGKEGRTSTFLPTVSTSSMTVLKTVIDNVLWLQSMSDVSGTLYDYHNRSPIPSPLQQRNQPSSRHGCPTALKVLPLKSIEWPQVFHVGVLKRLSKDVKRNYWTFLPFLFTSIQKTFCIKAYCIFIHRRPSRSSHNG